MPWIRHLVRSYVNQKPHHRSLTKVPPPRYTYSCPYEIPRESMRDRYDSIMERLYSKVDPPARFNMKREMAAVARGDIIHLHDGNELDSFDVLISDVNHHVLHTDVAQDLGLEYLSQATEEESRRVLRVAHGYIYGFKRRTIIPMVVSHGQRSRWIFFLSNSGSPKTYLANHACQLLNIDDETNVRIGGHHHNVMRSPLNSHFHDISLLGTDFCHALRCSKFEDYPNRTATFYFGGRWMVTKKTTA